MRIAVIGAGPAGLTAAVKLAQAGVQVVVLEAGPNVGGLARTLKLWGHRVDLGPHRFFSTDARVNRLWLDFAGGNYAMIKRKTRILYDGRYFDYPLSPANVIRTMRPVDMLASAASYARQQFRHTPNVGDSFEAWVVHRFGRRLYELFFKSYSEKLWGIPCRELSADFAAQRIRALSLGQAAISALSTRWARRHRTLVDSFAYPSLGTGAIYEAMADRVRMSGSEVQLCSPVRRVVVNRGAANAVQLCDGSVHEFDQIISTMPLSLLVAGMEDAPSAVRAAAASLHFRNTLMVYLHVDSARLFDDQWIYVHSPRLGVGRVTNYRNWSTGLHGPEATTVLSAEYWCNDSDSNWTANDQFLIARAEQELRSTGLLGTAALLDGHVERISRCYPVYRKDYRHHVDTIAQYLRSISNLTILGRSGAFKYNNQDHSILMGILAAENIVAHRDHDLWAVNSDFSEYQEQAVITATGLQPQSAAMTAR